MAHEGYRLVVANKNDSSWSLRAWLFMREGAIPLEEIRVPMFTPTWAQDIAQFTPSGRVPVLIHGEISVWDTTAIIQYIRERHPEAIGWPVSAAARAHAQSVCGEMHSGFLAIRDELPLNIRARRIREPSRLSASCVKQINRVDQIWSECRDRYGESGKWLFGDFSLADVMFAPVALRFLSYGIPVSHGASEFQIATCNLESVREWITAANAELETIPFIDDLIPAARSPLTLG